MSRNWLISQKIADLLGKLSKRAASLAARVGAILREETGIDPEVDAFVALANHYLCLPE